MGLNGISEAVSSYASTKPDTTKKTTEKETDKTAAKTDTRKDAYTPSKETYTDNSKQIYKQDMALVNKLKAEADSRTQSLRSLVEKMLLKQGQKFTSATNMYQLLREGKLDIDPATAKQAQADIGENGYWGVEQTSERLFSFAQALTGGDPSKAEEMKAAVLKGFKQAEKAWGGKLPDICQQTYDATVEKFDAWINTGKAK